VGKFGTFLIILVATLIDEWLPGWIPVNRLPISHFWQILIIRTIMTTLALFAMKIFYPSSLRRLTHEPGLMRFFIAIALIAYLVLPTLLNSNISSYGPIRVVEGITFALFIGINEEFFSRGFIYATLERYGVPAATIISSLYFGLLHFGNLLWGGQSFSYTLGQVIDAGTFGYLCVGLMLYTGNIWFPIVLHGLNDTAMQFEGVARYTKEVTGRADWLGTIALTVVYCAAGWLLIQFSQANSGDRIKIWFRTIFMK
jgi:membrane protease YdiL (CAAX protease family)